MKILVTGGAGYLGSMLVPRLLELGQEVTVFDNFRYRQTSLNAVCINPNLKIIKGDVRNYPDIKPLVAESDVVIPLAALVGAPLCNLDRAGAIGTNYRAIKMMAEQIAQNRLPTKVIVPITNSGYGIGEKGVHCTEETSMRPISIYGRTKCDAEQALFEFCPDNVVSLRLATVFGMSHRMRLDLLVNDFVYRAVHDRAVVLFEPHFMRNYISVRDIADVFVFAIENFDKMKGNAFNVGLSDANLSKMELCKRIQMQIPSFVFVEAPIGEDPDKRDYIVSNAKIEALGWKPHVSLDMGIAELKKAFTYLKNAEYGNY